MIRNSLARDDGFRPDCHLNEGSYPVRYLISYFLAALFLVSPTLLAEEEIRRVTVGINHAPPYRISTENGETGLYVEIFNEIAKRIDWEVRYLEAPFRRILRMMEEGEVDIMLGPLKTRERENIMAFVAPVFPPERKLFFYHRDENRIDQYDDLYGKRIGVLDGASYFEAFDTDQKLDKESVVRYENLMQMLIVDRVDVVVAPELVGRYMSGRAGAAILISPFQVPGEHSYIAVAKTSPVSSHHEKIMQAFEQIRENGVYEKLISEYRDPAAK
jgi:polar amino acid transport system substrate-binding protein